MDRFVLKFAFWFEPPAPHLNAEHGRRSTTETMRPFKYLMALFI